jgi:SAM-dependent methyltransferase
LFFLNQYFILHRFINLTCLSTDWLRPMTSGASFHCRACDGIISTSNGSKNGYIFWRCTGCGTITIDPFPTLAELEAFYKSYAGTTDYTKKERSKIRRATQRIKRLKRLTKGRRFLDVGCNYGFGVVAAHALGLDAHGIDVDSTAIASDQQRYAGRGTFTHISVEDYAARGAKADIIYTSEVIEHVPNADSFVAAMSTILNTGGVLYLTTPDASHWRVPKDFTTWDQVIPPEHLTYFTRKGMKILLERHGFKNVRFGFNMKPGIRVMATK